MIETKRFASGLLVSLSLIFHTTAHAQFEIRKAPSAAISNKIDQLDVSASEKSQQRLSVPRELNSNNQNIGSIGKQKIDLNSDNNNSKPFLMPNSMIIQFSPDASPTDIDNYIKEKNATVIEKFPTIGAVQVEADLSKYFAPKLTDKDQNETLSRGISAAIKDFRSDARIQSATPDILLTQKDTSTTNSVTADPEITNVLLPSDIVTDTSTDASTTEQSDWGLNDIEAASLWSMPRAQDGVIFGIMDAGFARHDDLSFVDFPASAPADNHGNHVAGIACGRHNNKGVRGVLPNCLVRARTGDVFFQSGQGNQQLRFMVLFSQILRTLDRFVAEQDDVSTFNVSLGYNWRTNFGINPDLPESAEWRALVESQGAMLVTLLEIADRKGKVIFSAAGNDSSGLATPIGAKYASPFNWAAIVSREQGRAENGIIVGAHGPDGKRASFSNSQADLSCPGVNILSSLAFDETKKISASTYGKMSGTSMASPYCAAAHVLFRLVRPGYTGVEITRCLMSSDALTELGTPRLRLTQALTACPARQ